MCATYRTFKYNKHVQVHMKPHICGVTNINMYILNCNTKCLSFGAQDFFLVLHSGITLGRLQ